jgi:hypothetical protein
METLIYAQIGNILNQAQAKTKFSDDELFVLRHALKSFTKGVSPDQAINDALTGIKHRLIF